MGRSAHDRALRSSETPPPTPVAIGLPSKRLGDRAARQIQGAEGAENGVVVREEAHAEDGEHSDRSGRARRLPRRLGHAMYITTGTRR